MNAIENVPKQDTFIAKVALILALLTLLLLIWFWLSSQQHFQSIEKSLSKKLEQSQSINQQSLALAKQADERSAKTQAQTVIISEKLAESRDQQEVLQTLYNQLAENRELTAIAEVEQLVTIANQQLKLTGNIKSALLALEAADQHLEPLHLPRATQLRQTLGNEIESLRKFPQIDPVEMANQIESIATLCADLPLISEHEPALYKKIAQAEQLHTGHLSRAQAFFYQIWADIKNLVTIERIDRPQAPLLTNEHRFYLRENLKLRLLSARIALLQHDQASYQADLTLVRQWLQQYYDMQHPNAIKALKLLNQLIENRVSLELPELKESLNAINRYKLSLENPH